MRCSAYEGCQLGSGHALEIFPWIDRRRGVRWEKYFRQPNRFMDLVFCCPNCRQELEADAAGAGTQIECPQCGYGIIIPDPTPQNIRATPASALNVPAGAASTPAAGSAGGAANSPSKERKFTLPVSDKKVKIDISRQAPSLEMEAKAVGKKAHLKCFKNADYAAKGPAAFEQAVSEFLQSLGEHCLISAHPIQYSFVDAATKQVLTDFGVLICYKE